MRVLDLFSAAAGGWSLGLHRAGFRTVAACEWISWRRALYAENNPGVPIYDDVRTLTAARLRGDLGIVPDVIVGSPPCQDISSANTKGRGVEGERSGLYFEAVRLVGECRPRWFAFENSANLRSRGADRVLGALEGHGYACWAFVVSAEDLGANHERKRSWLIGCDLEQIAGAYQAERGPFSLGRCDRDGETSERIKGADRHAEPASSRNEDERASPDTDLQSDRRPVEPGPEGQGRDLSCFGPAVGDRGWGTGAGPLPGGHGGLGRASDPDGERRDEGRRGRRLRIDVRISADTRDTDEGQQGTLGSLRGRKNANDARGAGRAGDRPGSRQVGICAADRGAALQHRADWSLADLAGHIRVDDGLPAWLADLRLEGGSAQGDAAAPLLVEAFGDAVIPQIPEAIGRAILRVEAAYAALRAPRAA